MQQVLLHLVVLRGEIVVIQHESRVRQVIRNIVYFEAVRQVAKVIVIVSITSLSPSRRTEREGDAPRLCASVRGVGAAAGDPGTTILLTREDTWLLHTSESRTPRTTSPLIEGDGKLPEMFSTSTT